VVKERIGLFNRFVQVLTNLQLNDISTDPFRNAAPASAELERLIVPFLSNPEASATEALDIIQSFFGRALDGGVNGLCEDVDPLTKNLECFIFDPLCWEVISHWWGLEIKFCNPAAGQGGWPPLCPCSTTYVYWLELALAVGLAVFLANPQGAIRAVGVAVARAIPLAIG
jgi:hypothetical protein